MDENIENFLKEKFIKEYNRSIDEIQPVIDK